MEKLTNKHHLSSGFSQGTETEFFLQSIGYDDFHHVQPLKTARQQSYHTLHIVLNGSGTLHLGNQTFRVNAHDMFYVPPDTNLIYYPDDDNLWDYIWFVLDGKNASHYADLLGLNVQHPVMPCNDFAQTFLHIHQIFYLLEITNQVGYYDVLSVFYKILNINLIQKQDTMQSLLERALAYINTHYYQQDFKMDDLCYALNISHSYLCKIFKRKHPTNAKQYLIQVRMQAAAKLLQTTDLTAKEIAASVGFADDIHFLKAFKLYWHCTCKEYRTSKRKSPADCNGERL